MKELIVTADSLELEPRQESLLWTRNAKNRHGLGRGGQDLRLPVCGRNGD